MAKTITISDWGFSQLQSYAASNALTYVGHFGGAGLINMDEFNTMERWRKLAADLSGDKFEPLPLDLGRVKYPDPSKIKEPE